MRAGLLLLLLVGCVSHKQSVELQAQPAPELRPALLHNLDAGLYQATAAEYRALCAQVYASARAALPQLLQEADPAHDALPAAIILDLDETVLDNFAYQCFLLRANGAYSRENWNEWVKLQEARLLPGALDFLQEARGRNIALFYVSNRYPETRAETLANLRALGLPLEEERLLLKEGPSDKSDRRAQVARSHRVIMMVGDNLGDFDARFDATDRSIRLEALRESAQHFGRDWFLLPNPVYGTWLRAVEAELGKGESLETGKIRILQEAYPGLKK
jgi:5'-nucleotidase (lipoprotein e(P4) family)